MVTTRRAFVLGTAAIGFAASGGSMAATQLSAFGAQSTGEEVTAGLDLTGKTAVVTGITSGIGYETMRVLALRGAHVIGTGRTLAGARKACESIEGATTPVALELGEFPSVVKCADAIQALNLDIDILILNAGLRLDGLEQVNGIEKQFVVNHLGHFILANRLLNRLRAAKQGRVIAVGSGNHRDAPPNGIQFDDLSGKGWSDRAYAHSKLAVGLFSLELAQRLQGTHATSNCVTPGLTATKIVTTPPSANGPRRKTPAQGAATACYVATNPALAEVSGEYFADCNPAPQAANQTDKAMAAQLWAVSTKLTQAYLG